MDISNYDFGSKKFNSIANMLVNKRQNIIIDAAAGTGKTTFAKRLKEVGDILGFKVLLTAVTGVAADNIGGSTISSKCYLELYHLEDHEIEERCDMDIELSSTRILVIDEGSMLKPEELRQINLACQAAKCDYTRPFGGIIVLLIGDYCQLEPIEISEVGEISAVNSVLVDLEYVHSLGFKSVALKEIFRQTDPISLRFLNALRDMIYKEKVDENMILEIKNFLSLNESKGVSIYSNIKDVPMDTFDPSHYYHPIGNAPYSALPIMYGKEYLVTQNSGRYYNGKTITLTEENENDFYVKNFTYKKVPGKDRKGRNALLTKIDQVDAEYLALIPLADMTTRRVQGLTLESGSIAVEFFAEDNKVRRVSLLGWLRTLYTALGRFTDLSNVSLC